MYKHISGIILSGGSSSRMGVNKAFLSLGNKKVIEHVRDLMCSVFNVVILITNTPDDYGFLDLPMFPDIVKITGPLTGIHSGLENTLTEDNFILSCDMPLMESRLIKSIIEFKTDKPIKVFSSEGHNQYLAGVYSRSVSQAAYRILQKEFENTLLNKGKHKAAVYSLLNEVGYETVEAEKIEGYHPKQFFNLNDKKDYKKILTLF